MARCKVPHFKPAAGAFNYFLLGFQQLGLAAGVFNRFRLIIRKKIAPFFVRKSGAHAPKFNWKRACMPKG
jgi:hypothetical protein